MAVALISTAESVRTGTTDPWTFTYNPGSTVRGVAVAVVHGVQSASLVNSVTYGGQAMSLVASAADTAGEPGRCEVWFLGASVPTGEQTVSVDLTSATGTDMHFIIFGLSGDDDLEVVDSDTLSEDAANPTVTLQKDGRTAITIAGLYHGNDVLPGDFRVASGITRDQFHDFNPAEYISVGFYETTPDDVDQEIGYSNLPSNDVGLVGLAVSEVEDVPATIDLNPITPSVAFPTFTVEEEVVDLTHFDASASFTAGTVAGFSIDLTALDATPLFPEGSVSGEGIDLDQLDATPAFDVNVDGTIHLNPLTGEGDALADDDYEDAYGDNYVGGVQFFLLTVATGTTIAIDHLDASPTFTAGDVVGFVDVQGFGDAISDTYADQYEGLVTFFEPTVAEPSDVILVGFDASATFGEPSVGDASIDLTVLGVSVEFGEPVVDAGGVVALTHLNAAPTFTAGSVAEAGLDLTPLNAAPTFGVPTLLQASIVISLLNAQAAFPGITLLIPTITPAGKTVAVVDPSNSENVIDPSLTSVSLE